MLKLVIKKNKDIEEEKRISSSTSYLTFFFYYSKTTLSLNKYLFNARNKYNKKKLSLFF